MRTSHTDQVGRAELKVLLLLVAISASSANEASTFINVTFQDILGRVENRDDASGAILRVRAR
jgi:hypothetical protein